MKQQKLVLNNIDSFELHHIFDCGQCFRWDIQPDGSYIGVIKSGVMRVSKVGNSITFEGILDGDINSIVYDYFDLGTDYNALKNRLAMIDSNMKKSVEFGSGIRILKQDLWEMIISYIISANNNIPRIKGIINRISERVGRKVSWNGVDYYLFPTVEELAKLSVSDLRELGTGFRDKRIYKTTQMILNKKIDLECLRSAALRNDSDLDCLKSEALKNENDIERLKGKCTKSTDEIRESLLNLDGVGEKVADCILLFGLHRFDTFPVDVWVRRVMNTLYIHNEDETKVNKKQIRDVAYELFGDIEGIAQQYLFYWARENFDK